MYFSTFGSLQILWNKYLSWSVLEIIHAAMCHIMTHVKVFFLNYETLYFNKINRTSLIITTGKIWLASHQWRWGAGELLLARDRRTKASRQRCRIHEILATLQMLQWQRIFHNLRKVLGLLPGWPCQWWHDVIRYRGAAVHLARN